MHQKRKSGMWIAKKPANIALIKYMGKKNTKTNTPTNASLSYTLKGLYSTVTLETHSKNEDIWQPALPNMADKNNDAHTSHIINILNKKNSAIKNETPFILDDQSKLRFLKHLCYVKDTLGYKGYFIVRSCNNFPANCGLASSASSFAALTQCAIDAISSLSPSNKSKAYHTDKDAAKLSQNGSGSSCRSFFSPWAIWNENGPRKINLPYPKLHHAVVVLSSLPKAVSSSEAHLRVQTSPSFSTRAQRAQSRLSKLICAFQEKDWASAFEIAWDEFQDMHHLFETASDPFNYAHPKLAKILDYLKNYWDNKGDGPLVTMDAGPNVHLLFREDQTALLTHMKEVLTHQ